MEVTKNIFTVRHNETPPEAGCVLIAEPFMKGFYFQRAVVLLTEHSASSSMGLVLNKPLNIMLNEFDPKMKFPYPMPLFIGGPIQPKRLFFVHTLGSFVPGSIQIADGLYIDGDMRVILDYLMYRVEDIPSVRFFAGYSGWRRTQLQDEIEDDSWLVSHISAQKVMMAQDKSAWKESLSAMGRMYQIWAHYPIEPRLN